MHFAAASCNTSAVPRLAPLRSLVLCGQFHRHTTAGWTARGFACTCSYRATRKVTGQPSAGGGRDGRRARAWRGRPPHKQPGTWNSRTLAGLSVAATSQGTRETVAVWPAAVPSHSRPQGFFAPFHVCTGSSSLSGARYFCPTPHLSPWLGRGSLPCYALAT